MNWRPLLLALMLLPVLALPAQAHDGENHTQDNNLPPLLQGVEIEQKLGTQMPGEATFRDERGETVKLGDYFGDKPVILTLNYYNCPQLCPIVLESLLISLEEVDFDIGKEFDVVTVSIDPRETPELARETEKRYIERYDRPTAEEGWHFLTGDEASIHRLADEVGFSYKYNPRLDQYVHGAGILILTPEGKASRYFLGIEYPPRDVRLGLVEAAGRKIGSLSDQALLFCLTYDPHTAKYTMTALNAVRLGGIVTMVALGGFVLTMLRRERRQAVQIEETEEGNG